MSLLCVTVSPNLLAVTDEDGGIMIVDTSMSGTQSIVQGKTVVCDRYLFILLHSIGRQNEYQLWD